MNKNKQPKWKKTQTGWRLAGLKKLGMEANLLAPSEDEGLWILSLRVGREWKTVRFYGESGDTPPPTAIEALAVLLEQFLPPFSVRRW